MNIIINKLNISKVIFKDLYSIKSKILSLYKNQFEFIQNIEYLYKSLEENIEKLAELNKSDPQGRIKFYFKISNLNDNITKNFNEFIENLKVPINKNAELGSTEINIIESDIDTTINNFIKYKDEVNKLDKNIVQYLASKSELKINEKTGNTEIEDYVESITKYTIKFNTIDLYYELITCLYDKISNIKTSYINNSKINSIINDCITNVKLSIMNCEYREIDFNNLQKFGLSPLSEYMTPQELYLYCTGYPVGAAKDLTVIDKKWVDEYHDALVFKSKSKDCEWLRKYVPILGVKTGCILITNIVKNNVFYNIENLIDTEVTGEFIGLSEEYLKKYSTIQHAKLDKPSQKIDVIHPFSADHFIIIEELNSGKDGKVRLLGHSQNHEFNKGKTSNNTMGDNILYRYSSALTHKSLLNSLLNKRMSRLPIALGKNLNNIIDKILEEAKEPIPFDEKDLPLPFEFRFKVVNKLLEALEIEKLLGGAADGKIKMPYKEFTDLLKSDKVQDMLKSVIDKEFKNLYGKLDMSPEVSLTYISQLSSTLTSFKRNITENIASYKWTIDHKELWERKNSLLEIIDNVKIILDLSLFSRLTFDGLTDTVMSKAKLIERLESTHISKSL